MATFQQAIDYATANPNSDFAKELEQGIKSGALNEAAKKEGVDLSSFGSQQQQQQTTTTPQKGPFVQEVGEGIVKGAASTLTGLGTVTSKALSNLPGEAGKFFEGGVQEGQQIMESDALKATTPGQKIGKFAEQAAEFFIPAGKVAQVEKILASKTGVGLLEKLIPIFGEKTANIIAKAGELGTKATVRAGEGGGIVAIQSGGDSKETGTAAAISAAIPVGGAVAGAVISPFKALAGRLVENLGSGLSGVPGESLSLMKNNANVGKSTINTIKQGGQEAVLQKNASTIMNGISQVRQEARKAYGEAIGALKAIDINPKTFRNNVQSLFDKYGLSTSGKGREIANVEFTEVKNLKKANTIANLITDTELNGLSLNKTFQRLEDFKYPNAKTEEGLAFNAFVNDVASGLKSAIDSSTEKLGEINSKYSKDLQLTGAMEKIFGKIKFQNTTELNGVANKLETLFSEQGLDPKTIDDFLTRIGVSPAEFRTSEAVRQVENITTKKNSEGLGFAEVIRMVSSAVITPKAVRNAAIFTGLAEEQVKPILEKLAPAARATFIELFARK